MQKYLSADIKPGEALDSAAVARHCNMSHALSGLVAEPGRDQFVVAPHRAIEEHQRRAGKARLQILIDAGAGGEKIEVFAASLVANQEPDCVARAVVSGGGGPPFPLPPAPTRNGEKEDFNHRRRASGYSRVAT